jgi:hypothetical protein
MQRDLSLRHPNVTEEELQRVKTLQSELAKRTHADIQQQKVRLTLVDFCELNHKQTMEKMTSSASMLLYNASVQKYRLSMYINVNGECREPTWLVQCSAGDLHELWRVWFKKEMAKQNAALVDSKNQFPVKQVAGMAVVGTIATGGALTISWPLSMLLAVGTLTGTLYFICRTGYSHTIPGVTTAKRACLTIQTAEQVVQQAKDVMSQVSSAGNLTELPRLTMWGRRLYELRHNAAAVSAIVGLAVLMISYLKTKVGNNDFLGKLRLIRKNESLPAVCSKLILLHESENKSLSSRFALVQTVAALCLVPLSAMHGLAVVLDISKGIHSVMIYFKDLILGAKLISSAFGVTTLDLEEEVKELRSITANLDPKARQAKLSEMKTKLKSHESHLDAMKEVIDDDGKCEQLRAEVFVLKKEITAMEGIVVDDDFNFRMEASDKVAILNKQNTWYIGLGFIVALLAALMYWRLQKKPKRVHVVRTSEGLRYFDDMGMPAKLENDSCLVYWQTKEYDASPHKLTAALGCVRNQESQKYYVFQSNHNKNKGKSRWKVYNKDHMDLGDLLDFKISDGEFVMADRSMVDDIRSDGYSAFLKENSWIVDPQDHNSHDYTISNDDEEYNAITDDPTNVPGDAHSQNVLKRHGVHRNKHGQIQANESLPGHIHNNLPNGRCECILPESECMGFCPIGLEASKRKYRVPHDLCKHGQERYNKKMCVRGDLCQNEKCQHKHKQGFKVRCLKKGCNCSKVHIYKSEALHGKREVAFAKYKRSCFKATSYIAAQPAELFNGFVFGRNLVTAAHCVRALNATDYTIIEFEEGTKHRIEGAWNIIDDDTSYYPIKFPAPQITLGPPPSVGDAISIHVWSYGIKEWITNIGIIRAINGTGMVYSVGTDRGYSGGIILDSNGNGIGLHTDGAGEYTNAGYYFSKDNLAKLKATSTNSSSSSSQ